MKKGEILLVVFPFSDLSSTKVRPVLVLHADQGHDAIFAMITSNIDRPKEEGDLALMSTHSDFNLTGLKTSSVLRLGKIHTLSRSLVKRYLGTCSLHLLKIIDDTLCKLLQL